MSTEKTFVINRTVPRDPTDTGVSGDQTLNDLHLRAGALAWPGVAVTSDRFQSHLQRAGTRREDEERNRCDLYLACACAAGDPTAIRLFESRLMPGLDSLFDRMRLRPQVADEVRQNVRVLLFTAPTMQIAAYAGRGTLSSWLRTVAARVALKVLTGRERDRPELAGEIVDRLVDSRADPELLALRARVGEPFQQALTDSLQALTPRARTVLRLHYVRGLDIDAIGDLYDVHRSTVARWLAATRTIIVSSLRERLGPTLRPTSSEFCSLVAALRDDLELSLDDPLGQDAKRATRPGS